MKELEFKQPIDSLEVFACWLVLPDSGGLAERPISTTPDSSVIFPSDSTLRSRDYGFCPWPVAGRHLLDPMGRQPDFGGTVSATL